MLQDECDSCQLYPGQDFQSNIKPIEVKGGHQLALTGEPANLNLLADPSQPEDFFCLMAVPV